MIYECTECDYIIPQGKPWFFGKDYLFCSPQCRQTFLLNNPNGVQPKIPIHVPEQTQPYYSTLPPSILLPSQVAPSQVAPSLIAHSPSSVTYISSLIEYTLCNLSPKKYIFSSFKDLL